jgi:hypothetical protein
MILYPLESIWYGIQVESTLRLVLTCLYDNFIPMMIAMGNIRL